MRGKVIYFSLFLILLPLWPELIAQLSLYTCPIEPGEESSQEPELEVRTFSSPKHYPGKSRYS